MKLVLAIVSHDDTAVVTDELLRAGYFVTRLASSGGFLHAGNTTLMLGVEDERAPALLELLALYCKKRTQITTTLPTYFSEGLTASLPVEVTAGGATVFVLDVEDYEKV